MNTNVIEWIQLLFWPTIWLIIFGWSVVAVWRGRQPGFVRTLVSLFLLDLFLWVMAVAVTRIIFLLTGHHTGAIWPLYWPVALVVIFLGMFIEVWRLRDLEPQWFGLIVMVALGITVMGIVALVAIPRLVGAANDGKAFEPRLPRTVATFSWASYRPGPSGYKCLTNVTGVTREQAKAYGKLVRAKKYDPRELVVVDEPGVNTTVARAQAFIEGIPQVDDLHVKHVSGLWVYVGPSCRAKWYSRSGVFVSATVPILRNHPVTSKFRHTVGVVSSGPWRIAQAPAP